MNTIRESVDSLRQLPCTKCPIATCCYEVFLTCTGCCTIQYRERRRCTLRFCVADPLGFVAFDVSPAHAAGSPSTPLHWNLSISKTPKRAILYRARSFAAPASSGSDPFQVSTVRVDLLFAFSSGSFGFPSDFNHAGTEKRNCSTRRAMRWEKKRSVFDKLRYARLRMHNRPLPQ